MGSVHLSYTHCVTYMLAHMLVQHSPVLRAEAPRCAARPTFAVWPDPHLQHPLPCTYIQVGIHAHAHAGISLARVQTCKRISWLKISFLLGLLPGAMSRSSSSNASLGGQTPSSDEGGQTPSSDDDGADTRETSDDSSDTPNTTGVSLATEVGASELLENSTMADCASGSKSGTSSSSSSSSSGGGGGGGDDSDSSGLGRVTANRQQLALESDAEHRSRHCDQGSQKHCVRCQFLKSKSNLEKACVWVDPLSGNRCSWLMQAPGADNKAEEWGVGCSLCRWAKTGTIMAKCEKKTLVHISRHNNQVEHRKALALFFEDKLPGGLTPDPDGKSKSNQQELIVGPGGKTPEIADRGVGFAHVLKVLEVCEQGESLRSFTKSMGVIRHMAGDCNPGNDSRTVGRHLLSLCAGNEIVITKSLFDAACVAGISQDARDSHLLVCGRVVVWRLPREAKNPVADGIKSVLPGGNGPWVAERILGVATLGSDRSAVATAKATLSLIQQSTCQDENFKDFQHKCLFYCTDNAADEVLAGELLQHDLPRLKFHMTDSSHSLMLAIKNGCKGDPEVDLVQGIFLTNKKPHQSIANMLRHSKRFRSSFTDEQQDDIFATLSHLGWAPQRMTSRARSWSRGALKIGAVFKALAREAEEGPRKEAALHNLQMLAPYKRLMISGLLADLTVEHQICVRQTDVSDPDPAELPLIMRRFENRVDILFTQGEVLRMEHSFTAQILKFLEKPSVLLVKKYAVLFAKPSADDQAAIFEPLQRMRAIAGNVLACMRAALPDTAWQVQLSCFLFAECVGAIAPGPCSSQSDDSETFSVCFHTGWTQ